MHQRGTLAAAVAATGVLLAACGGGLAAGSGSTPFQKAETYAHCMRSHGDPAFPDPDSQGFFIHDQADAAAFSGPQAQAAIKACSKLRPPVITAAQRQQLAQRELRFSACMRSHGYPSFPDPEPDGSGFNDGNIQAQGIDMNSVQYQSANNACTRLTQVDQP